jgi:hypothetical protein
MSLLDHLPKGFKDLVVEDEEVVVKPQAVKATSAGVAGISYAPPQVSVPQVYTPTVTAPVDNDIYRSLLEKTDFNSTPVGKVLVAKLDLLKETPLDERTKLVTALKIGSAENLNAQSILSTFDGLIQTLQAESDNFNKSAQAALDKEVNGRQTKLQEIASQIADLQRQQTQISSDLIDQQGKIQHGQMMFKAAFSNRSLELENQKAHFSSLLQG